MSADLRNKILSCIETVQKYVYGQDEILKAIMAAIACEGHILIEGAPGLGKTQSISLISQLADLKFKRVQFTPDLMPTDLIGTLVFGLNTEDFKVKFGPIFTQILLADEINRSPAKVQSALLEAMEERQVTIGDQSYQLTSPFVVLATQNPIEQEGTYQLPEAQLDRFMMKMQMTYPSFEAERKILDRKDQRKFLLDAVMTSDDLVELKDAVEKVYVDEKIKDLIVKIVHATRPQSKNFNSKYQRFIKLGASPRASLWMYRLAKYEAFMQDKDYVSIDNIIHIAKPVLCHRIIATYDAQLGEISMHDLVGEIVEQVIHA